MPNRNYLKGVTKERKLVNEARARGFISFRSAGSHSLIDCVIIDSANRTIKLIQCKPDNYSRKQKALLLEKFKGLNGSFEVTFSIE